MSGRKWVETFLQRLPHLILDLEHNLEIRNRSHKLLHRISYDVYIFLYMSIYLSHIYHISVLFIPHF